MSEYSNQYSLPLEAELLLPHRPPMLFVDRLVERQGDKAVAEALLPEGGIACGGGKILPEYFIELIAQTSALANGFDMLLDGKKPNDGMLVGVDSFRFFHSGQMGTSVRIEIEKSFSFGPVSVINGRVTGGGETLASGELKVWENVE